MEARSYAKVNLWLHVLGKRPDGFHDLETVFHTISLHDDLHIEATGSSIEVTMDPDIDDNLAGRAAHRLARHRRVGGIARISPNGTHSTGGAPGARIDIRKSIPLGAGLAGGSGNAAAVLLALDHLWDLALDRAELLSIAAELGSDIPFLLEGGTALGRGRGDELTPLPRAELWFVLGISHHELSTAAVYNGWRPSASTSQPALDDFRAALEVGDPEAIAEGIHNDLEEPAFHLRPELSEKKDSMMDAGAVGSFLSGSGPTIVGVARDRTHARSVARALAGGFDRVEVARSHHCGVELDGRRPL